VAFRTLLIILGVRLFIILGVRLCLTDSEAKPRALCIKYGAGKPQAFRTKRVKCPKPKITDETTSAMRRKLRRGLLKVTSFHISLISERCSPNRFFGSSFRVSS